MVITCCSSLQFILASHGITANEVSLKSVLQGISTDYKLPGFHAQCKSPSFAGVMGGVVTHRVSTPLFA